MEAHMEFNQPGESAKRKNIFLRVIAVEITGSGVIKTDP